MSNDQVGSLALLPKRPRVWGDDQTTTLARKWAAMDPPTASWNGSIDMPPLAPSRTAGPRTTLIVVSVALACLATTVVVLALRAMMRWLS